MHAVARRDWGPYNLAGLLHGRDSFQPGALMCMMLRRSAGCDVIDAVEGALISMWVCRKHHLNNSSPAARCTQCSSVLDLSIFCSQRAVTLWTNCQSMSAQYAPIIGRVRFNIAAVRIQMTRLKVQMRPTLPRLCINALYV